MRQLHVPSGAGHVAWDSECVCMRVYACARVSLYRVHFGTTFMHVHACVHACARVCTCVCMCVHTYGCVDVCHVSPG